MHARNAGSLVTDSFLRRVDPRTKLLLCLAASTAVMLSLTQIAAVTACYVLLTVAAGTTRHALAQLRRIAPLLLILFTADWLFIGLQFAVLITLRLALLVSAFILFVGTTTPDELQLALERMGIPARLSFTFAVAYRSLGLLETEWQGIREAQRARGIVLSTPSWRDWHAWRRNLERAVSLLVPAIVLATQRAWSVTEAAAARGFESPQRCASRGAALGWIDHALLAATAGLLLGLAACQ